MVGRGTSYCGCVISSLGTIPGLLDGAEGNGNLVPPWPQSRSQGVPPSLRDAALGDGVDRVDLLRVRLHFAFNVPTRADSTPLIEL